jgi:hypothetical protein
VSQSIVRLPFDGVVEGIVPLLEGGELSGGAGVVVQVWMYLLNPTAERFLDVFLGGVLGDVE